MPAIIESVATAASRRKMFPKGALRLADDATAKCLGRAQKKPSDLDILVNAGVYREKNLAEPALASMIQEDVGANPGHPPNDRTHGTFSFDVSNGGCGVITALEIVDGFVRSRTAQLGIVVASDSDPGNTERFPFHSVGGAVLLRPGLPGAGFQSFMFENFPEHQDAFESHLAWHDREHPGPLSAPGENVLEISEQAGFAAFAVDKGELALRRYLQATEVRPAEIDLVIASTYPLAFAAELAWRLGIPEDRLSIPEERLRSAHTAGVIAALEAAMTSGRLAAARNTLLVAVGSGITVAAALYRHGGEQTALPAP